LRAFACPNCGAPLDPGPHDVRARCAHCGTAVDVTSEGGARVASALQRAGIRVAAQPMTQDDIAARLAEQAAAEQAKLRQARVIALVVSVLFLVVLGVVLLVTSTAGG